MPRDYRHTRPAGSAGAIVFGQTTSITRKHAWQCGVKNKQPYMFCTREHCDKKWWPDQTEESRGNCKDK